MGPSGFQTKGLEYRGVVASLFFSLLLALCDVLSTGIFPIYRGGMFSRCLYYSVGYSYWMSYSFPARYF